MMFSTLFKRMMLGCALASVPILGGCGGNTQTWTEEVKLLDGQVITVTQKRRYEGSYSGQDFGSVVRESWLTFKLPEPGNQEISWHENLKPRILNLYNGKLYVVGWVPTGQEFDLYGKPQPPYIGFRYESGRWLRIPFAEIPVSIYDTNLWIENDPPNKTGHISFEDKAVEMRNDELPNPHKRIDPNLRW